MQPDNFVPLIFRHFWIAFIAVTLVNVFIFRKRAQTRFQNDPALLASANRLLWGFAFWGNLPWLLMGIGIMNGQVPGIHDFLWAAQENAYVRLWYGAMAGLLALGSLWMYFGRGVQSVSKVAIEANPIWTPKVVGWAWAGAVLWNVVLGTAMFRNFMGFQPSGLPVPDAPGPIHFFEYFPFLFIAGWVGGCFLLSLIGGWWSLATEYKLEGDFDGKKLWFRSGRLGMTGYGACLVLGAGSQGFYLSVLPLFRLGHPPLLIPWQDVEVSEESVFWVKRVVFRFKKVPKIRFALPKQVALKLRELHGAAALKAISE